MRTLRMSLAGTVMLALLGGLGVAAVAQDEEEMPVTATHVTGTRLTQAFDGSEAVDVVDEFGLEHHRGWRIDETWEWSDPRLPAARAGVWDTVAHQMVADGPLAVELGIEDTTLAVGLGAVRLDGPEGSWTGTEIVLYDEIERDGIGQDIYVGEGAYDGLTAVLECIDATCDGYILEGTFPPMPDLVEPLAE